MRILPRVAKDMLCAYDHVHVYTYMYMYISKSVGFSGIQKRLEVIMCELYIVPVENQ